MSKVITALLASRIQADTTLRRLETAGFAADQVSLLMSEQARNNHFTLVENDKTEEGAVAGATIAGLAGALYMGLISAGAILIPGLNLIVSGALIGALAGLGAGGAVGGLVGALVGSGIPEHEAKLYEKQVREGGILIAVQALNDKEEESIKNILKDANAQSIKALAA